MITVMKYSFKEMFNKKALLLVIVLTLVFLTLYGYGLKEAYKDLPRSPVIAVSLSSQLISIGLYFAGLIIAFLVVLSSVGALSADIESGVMQAVLVKPVKRWEIVVGKFLGIGAMISLYGIVLFFAIIFLNKFYGARMIFSPSNLFYSALLFILSPIILLSLSLWGSSRMSTLNTGIMVVMLYGFALIGGWMEQIGYLLSRNGGSAQGLINAGIISSLILPTDVLYRKMNSLLFTTDGLKFLFNNILSGGYEPSIAMMIYSAAYPIFMLWMAVKSFSSRDI
ncbi:ABC transporter permease subunit [Thermosediminibacter litoriperuensis]|uniref:ABC-2 family transporter n=1 Tax=Thermosediminibacter litoriperuensis TaxID=291989 RepID=A0A5S5AWH7_9FIRM|nr:ABC transporter permease subunit [Thermosediminibacter litoriperuensis]TYP56721.1 ABC-2 family transporter [Thermosediminibacter litoriperuensis]